MPRSLNLFSDDRVRLSNDDALAELQADLLRTSFRAGEFELPNGITSSGYFQKYRFVTRPAILRRLGRFIAELVPQTTDRLAAPTLGASLIGAAVSLETGLPLAVVRSGADAERPGVQAIEGGLYGGERVTLIEDVVVTGTRAAAALAQLRAAGTVVTTIISVIDGLHGAADRFDDVDYRPLMTVRDLGLPEDIFRVGVDHRSPDQRGSATGADRSPELARDAAEDDGQERS